MAKLRWLRTEWMNPVALSRIDASGNEEVVDVQFLRAVRSDGQMFEAHAEVGPEATPEALRAHLDTMLEDLEMPSQYDEDGQWSPQVELDFGKGTGNWVEEE